MLDAFIVDQLKKAEEEKWIEDHRLVLEIPQYVPEDTPKKSEKERGITIIQF